MGRMSHLLTDTVTMESESSVDGYADPSYGAQSSISARVEEVDTVIVGTDHNEYKSTARFATEDEVSYTDRFYLPNDNPADSNTGRRPLKINHSRFPGETEGLYVVYL